MKLTVPKDHLLRVFTEREYFDFDTATPGGPQVHLESGVIIVLASWDIKANVGVIQQAFSEWKEIKWVQRP